MQLDSIGRTVALTVETTAGFIGARIISLLYDRVAGRTVLVDTMEIATTTPHALLAFSGDGAMVVSNIFFYSRAGYSTVKLDRTTGYAFRSFNSGNQATELSFTGDIGVAVRSPGVYVLDFDRDDDRMDDDWETAFGLDASMADGALDPDEDGQTKLQEHEAGTHPRGVFKRYLAEGAVNAFFTTRLAIVNPGAERATVSLNVTVNYLRLAPQTPVVKT